MSAFETPPQLVEQAAVNTIVFQGIQRAAGFVGAAILVAGSGIGMAIHESHEAGSPRDVTAAIEAGTITKEQGGRAIEAIRGARESADDIRTAGWLGGLGIATVGLGFTIFTANRKLNALPKSPSAESASGESETPQS